MSVDLTAVQSKVTSMLNADRGDYGGGSVVPHFPDGDIQEGVNAAALGVMMAIYDTPGHQFRAAAMNLFAFTDGSLITNAIGGLLIDGVAPVKISASKMRRFKTNRLGLTTIAGGGYTTVQGRIINFIGSAGLVETLKTLSGTDFNCPDAYEPLCVSGGFFLTVMKQGSNVQAGEAHGKFYMDGLQLIRKGATAISPPTFWGSVA